MCDEAHGRFAEPVAETPKPVVVEVEINRLSSIPDLIDDDSPIELPPITPSGSVIAAPHIYTPVLAESFYVQAPQRPPTAVVPMTVAEGKPKRHKPQRRKKKRHPFRTFMTLVILLGLLAGGAFAAKKYLLHSVNWSAELKPLADGVATERGLEFKLSVHVTELPAADYAHAPRKLDHRHHHRPRASVAGPRPAQWRVRSRRHRTAGHE